VSEPTRPRRWVVQDRYGNIIYMTEERWQHALGHEDMDESLLEHVLDTLRTGQRKQNARDPSKYRYSKAFPDLPSDNQRVVVLVRFTKHLDEYGQSRPNNYVLTTFLV